MLRLNVHIPSNTSIDWCSILAHVEGVDMQLARCLALDKSITSSARFLTLRMKAHECEITSLERGASHFSHIRDLRIVFEGPDKSLPEGLRLGLEYFKQITALSLKLNLHGDLDLTRLDSLGSLHISSGTARHGLILPENVLSFVFEAARMDFPKLSPALLAQIGSLKHLVSMKLKYFDLKTHSNILGHLSASLLSLDVRRCLLPESIGPPRGQLEKLHLEDAQYTPQGDTMDLRAFKHLTALSCTWAVLKKTHASHLKALHLKAHYIEFASDFEPRQIVSSLNHFESLTELWLSVPLLTEDAIKQVRQENGILKVFPSALEILVLHDPYNQVLDGHSWDFIPLKRLRCLGLVHSFRRSGVHHEKLPARLHTIAVREDSVAQLRQQFLGEMAPIRVAAINEDIWVRGISDQRFLSNYSEGEHSEYLDGLQERQRDQEARHHHSEVPIVHTSSPAHASTSG